MEHSRQPCKSEGEDIRDGVFDGEQRGHGAVGKRNCGLAQEPDCNTCYGWMEDGLG